MSVDNGAVAATHAQYRGTPWDPKRTRDILPDADVLYLLQPALLCRRCLVAGVHPSLYHCA